MVRVAQEKAGKRFVESHLEKKKNSATKERSSRVRSILLKDKSDSSSHGESEETFSKGKFSEPSETSEEKLTSKVSRRIQRSTKTKNIGRGRLLQGLNTLRPTNPLYDRLLNFRTYHLKNARKG